MPGKNTDKSAPEIRLRVNGADMPTIHMKEVTVLQDVSAPGMFALRMSYWDVDRNLYWEDKDLFTEGREVEIQMGYAGSPSTTGILGEITGLEPEFIAGEVPMLTVRGYDFRHRLMFGRRTRSFTQVKDSAIARQVAEDAGLSAATGDTQVTHEYVLQHNQTDWEFLEGRARRLGFEVMVEGRTLKFQPHKNERSEEVITLSLDDLIEFRPRLSTRGLAGAVIVRGWSPKDKAPIAGQASAGDEGTTMGGRSGLARFKEAFSTKGSKDDVVVNRPVSSQAEAEQIAHGLLKEIALSYVAGEGVAKGCTDLKAGTVIKIKGLGKRFSGRYYLTSVCHTYSPRRGYRSAFTMGRNAT